MASVPDTDRFEYISMKRPEGFQELPKEVPAAQDPETPTKQAEKQIRCCLIMSRLFPVTGTTFYAKVMKA